MTNREDRFLERLVLEEARQKADAQRFADLPENTCQLCGAEGEDKRNLYIACFYAVHEMVPEAIDLTLVPDAPAKGYFLRICKACRGRFLGHLKVWRTECLAMRGEAMDHDGNLEPEPGRDVPVRINGAIQWMSVAEWQEWRKAKEAEEVR